MLGAIAPLASIILPQVVDSKQLLFCHCMKAASLPLPVVNIPIHVIATHIAATCWVMNVPVLLSLTPLLSFLLLVLVGLPSDHRSRLPVILIATTILLLVAIVQSNRLKGNHRVVPSLPLLQRKRQTGMNRAFSGHVLWMAAGMGFLAHHGGQRRRLQQSHWFHLGCYAVQERL